MSIENFFFRNAVAFAELTKLKNKILYERKTILRRGKEDALSSEEVLSDTRSSRFGSE